MDCRFFPFSEIHMTLKRQLCGLVKLSDRGKGIVFKVMHECVKSILSFFRLSSITLMCIRLDRAWSGQRDFPHVSRQHSEWSLVFLNVRQIGVSFVLFLRNMS